MKVEITWQETVIYESIIEVDPEDMAASGCNPDDIKGYLEALGQSDWFEQCDTSKDCLACVDREIISAVRTHG